MNDPSRRRAKVLDRLSRELAKADALSAQVKAAEGAAELVRLSKALEQVTANVCRTVEAELEFQRKSRAANRRSRERLAAMPSPSRAVH